MISREVIDNIYVRIFILALVLFFPTLSNLVEHAASSTGIVLALAGLPMILYREMRPTVSREEKWLMWAFAGYFAVIFLSFAVNALTGDLVDPHLKYIEKAMRILFFVPVYFLLRRIRLPQWILWYGMSIGAIVAGIYALIDAGAFHGFQPGYRVSGGYHSIAFGDLSLVIGFMSFSGLGYFRERHAALVLIPIAGLTLGMIACFLSGTRGAWIAMPILFFVAFLQLDGYLKPWLRGLTVGIICLVCFAAYAIPETGIANRINAVFDETEAYFQGDIVGGAGERYEIWKAAWNIYREHPFLGVGPGGVKSEIQKMIAEGRVDPVIAGYKRSHSSYFSAMAECGLVGLVALLAVFVVPLRVAVSAIRQGGAGRDVTYAGLMLIAGFMHFGLTETILGRSVFASFYVVMLAVTLSMLAQYRVEKNQRTTGIDCLTQ